MRKLILIFTLTLFCNFIVNSQPKPPSKDGMIKELTERLQLTNAQVEKVKAIFEKTDKLMQSKMEKMNPGEMKPPMEGMEKIMKTQDEEIEKLLTEEQMELFDKYKKERESRRPAMRPEMKLQ